MAAYHFNRSTNRFVFWLPCLIVDTEIENEVRRFHSLDGYAFHVGKRKVLLHTITKDVKLYDYRFKHRRESIVLGVDHLRV